MTCSRLLPVLNHAIFYWRYLYKYNHRTSILHVNSRIFISKNSGTGKWYPVQRRMNSSSSNASIMHYPYEHYVSALIADCADNTLRNWFTSLSTGWVTGFKRKVPSKRAALSEFGIGTEPSRQMMQFFALCSRSTLYSANRPGIGILLTLFDIIKFLLALQHMLQDLLHKFLALSE